MRRPMTLRRLVLTVSAVAVSGAALAADTDAQFHPGELLADTEHRQTWQKLVKNEERLPDWIINLSGDSEPTRALQADGEDYLVGRVCEPAHCLQQQVYVAFSWDKDEAYALYVQVPDALPGDKSPSRHATKRWLGEPDDDVRLLLEEQLKASPGWY